MSETKRPRSPTKICGKMPTLTPGRVGALTPGVVPMRQKRNTRRQYTAADAARIICYAVGAGVNPQDIKNKAGCCLGDTELQCEEELARLHKLLEFVMAVAMEAIAYMSAYLAALRVLRFVGALPLPWLRPVRNMLQLAGPDGAAIELARSQWTSVIEATQTLIRVAK